MVIDYKSEECNLNVKYVGIIRRVIAGIIDCFIVIVSPLILILFPVVLSTIKSLIKSLLITSNIKSLLIIYICLFLMLSIVFMVLMVKIVGGTPGQLLCGINIKDTNTLKNITLVQATIRYILFKVTSFTLSAVFIMNTFFGFLDQYISELWLDPLLHLIFTAIIVIFISAMFDRRKQFLHDKIAGTVAINYKVFK
ncbi:RDD family protein [Wolbachia endosymbiont of Pentidionis agamae]|uniref:RDD family protein n=1 Tax=Wolbachia endosymbiont of Pentidionis agamae TaxID=3110435 RepID=UPI002FD06BF8